MLVGQRCTLSVERLEYVWAKEYLGLYVCVTLSCSIISSSCMYTLRKKGCKKGSFFVLSGEPDMFSIRPFKGSMNTMGNLNLFSKQDFRTLKLNGSLSSWNPFKGFDSKGSPNRTL